MYLLDTNVVSELRKAAKADLRVVHWAEQAALVHGLTVATRNTKDFPEVTTVNPWLWNE